MQTVGLSPKTVAAAIATYLATLIGGIIAEKLGVAIDVNAVEAVLLPFISTAVTFAAAFLAKPGRVVNNPDDPAVR